MSSLSFLNATIQSSLPSQSTIKSPPSKNLFTSTLSYQAITSYQSNSTDHHDIPPLIVSIRTPNENWWIEKFHWQNILIYIIPILCGTILCIILSICACMKYRRKDAGVYELEETQRFRPLIVEIPPSPGENNGELLNTSKKNNIKSHQRRKRKKSPLLSTDEQREFYI